MELLRDRSAEFEQAGVRAFGISRDSAWTHIAWSQALDLNFPLLSDWNRDAMRRDVFTYGLWQFRAGTGNFAWARPQALEDYTLERMPAK